MTEIFDIYLLEAVVNGILLGGVLALLALGLNLIFGVIDVTWICYAELVMIGMYGMYYLVQYFGLSYFVAAPLTILLVAGLGALLHLLVIAPLLSAPPINQLLATAGLWRGAYRHGAGLSVHEAHLCRHCDPRHLAGSADHGADGRRRPSYLSHYLRTGRRAGRPRVLPAGAAIRHPSVCRPVVRNDHVPHLIAGWSRQFRRRLRGGVRVRRDHLAR